MSMGTATTDLRLHDREWQLRARCRNVDPSLFFHPDGERGRARKQRQQRAREVCADCPVARECGEHSISFQEAFGTWGGLSEDDRRRFLEDRVVRLRTRNVARQNSLPPQGAQCSEAPARQRD